MRGSVDTMRRRALSGWSKMPKNPLMVIWRVRAWRGAYRPAHGRRRPVRTLEPNTCSVYDPWKSRGNPVETPPTPGGTPHHRTWTTARRTWTRGRCAWKRETTTSCDAIPDRTTTSCGLGLDSTPLEAYRSTGRQITRDAPETLPPAQSAGRERPPGRLDDRDDGGIAVATA